jgi:hypothetical protein
MWLVALTLYANTVHSEFEQGDSTWRLVTLPRGIEIEVPASWREDSSKVTWPLPTGRSIGTLFLAHPGTAGTGVTAALILSLRKAPTQAQVAALTEADLARVDRDLRATDAETDARRQMPATWLGTTRERWGAWFMLISRLRQQVGGRVFLVEQCRIYRGSEVLALDLFYPEEDAAIWMPVLNRIRGSVRIPPHDVRR